MEISSKDNQGIIEVRAKGRLDASWAGHLTSALEELVRQGRHRITVDLSEITYVSSVGVRVLVTFYKKLEAIKGAFRIAAPSESVRQVLDMVGLRATLMGEAAQFGRTTMHAFRPPGASPLEHAAAQVEVHALKGAGLRGRLIGSPSHLDGCRFDEADCRPVSFPDSTIGLGLGALGGGFADCRDRFGEYLAVAGAAAYQPGDGTSVPDHVRGAGTLVAEVHTLYGLQAEGTFGHLARFEARPDARAVGLSDLAAIALEIAGADTAWVVLVAESAGLVGAQLRRPPIGGAAGAPFTHPEIRRWISFTTERAYPHALAVAVGIVTRAPKAELAPFVRPLLAEDGLSGHLHAAAFSYHPLQKGLIELRGTVRKLFESEQVLGLLHLVGDDRASGVAESEFSRGALWVGAATEWDT